MNTETITISINEFLLESYTVGSVVRQLWSNLTKNKFSRGAYTVGIVINGWRSALVTLEVSDEFRAHIGEVKLKKDKLVFTLHYEVTQ